MRKAGLPRGTGLEPREHARRVLGVPGFLGRVADLLQPRACRPFRIGVTICAAFTGLR